jgi:hypothetical protein
MNEAAPSAKNVLSMLFKLLLTFIAIALALAHEGKGLITLVLLYLAWQIKLIWTDKHG